jgi:antitoxin HicB
LKEEGIHQEVTTAAIKGVIALQLAREMKKQRITKKRLAELMRTSRAQIDRILDPDKGNVAIETLQRAAALVGRQLRFAAGLAFSAISRLSRDLRGAIPFGSPALEGALALDRLRLWWF